MSAPTGNSIRRGHRRPRPMPSEAYIYHALREGRALDEIGVAVGMSWKTLRMFIKSRSENWQENPPKKLTSDERRVVVTKEAYIDRAWRFISISLPRNSMHDIARSEAGA